MCRTHCDVAVSIEKINPVTHAGCNRLLNVIKRKCLLYTDAQGLRMPFHDCLMTTYCSSVQTQRPQRL